MQCHAGSTTLKAVSSSIIGLSWEISRIPLPKHVALSVTMTNHSPGTNATRTIVTAAGQFEITLQTPGFGNANGPYVVRCPIYGSSCDTISYDPSYSMTASQP